MRWIAGVLCCSLLAAGCSNGAGPTETETTTIASTQTSVVETPVETVTATPGESTETPSGTPTPEVSGTPKPSANKMEPLPGVDAPKLKKVVKVKFKTTQGDMLMEIYPEAAPNAAKRFEELVRAGFYDKTPLFRVVPDFVVQFGINSKPKMKEYKDKNFKDDPTYFKLTPGTLAFAKAGPNTNSTQVFIDLGDNSQLTSDQNGHFSAFGKVVKGMDVAKKFKQVGDPSMGLDQGAMWEDTQGYLDSLPEKPDMILDAEVVK